MMDTMDRVNKETVHQMIQSERIRTNDIEAQEALKVLVDNF